MRLTRGVFRNSSSCARRFCSLIFPAVLTFAIFASGCGGSTSARTSQPGGPTPGQSTTVAIQFSSTANDAFIEFDMAINQITLTNKAGQTTTIFNTPALVEFIHANGIAVPFATVTVPQDTYTSAAVSISTPSFTYASMDSQGTGYIQTDSTFATSAVINLANPITISGSAMGLILNLDAAQSGSYSGLAPNQISFTITPTFDLSAFAIQAQPTTAQNGKSIGIAAQISSVNGANNNITVALANARDPQAARRCRSVQCSARLLDGVSGHVVCKRPHVRNVGQSRSCTAT